MNPIDNQKFIAALRRAIKKSPMKERHRNILSFRYGLGPDNTIHTMKECSEMFVVTQERIRQINNRTIEKLGINLST